MAKREKKEKVRINLDVSKELAVKIKDKASEEAMAVNAFIRTVLDDYFKQIVK